MCLLNGKRILVTGAGDGIGKELTKSLMSGGTIVYAIGRTQSKLEKLQSECENSQNLHIKCLDVTNYDGVKEYVRSLPPLDGLVNNAGVAVIKPFLKLTPSEFDEQMEINQKGAFFMAQAVAHNMVNGKKSGSIVHVSSQASCLALANHSVYGMSKAALDYLAKSMALELGGYGIRVNCVNPTVVMTELGRKNWSDSAKAKVLLDRIPLRRFAECEDVIGPIKFLLSDDSSMVNATILPVEGGILSC